MCNLQLNRIRLLLLGTDDQILKYKPANPQQLPASKYHNLRLFFSNLQFIWTFIHIPDDAKFAKIPEIFINCFTNLSRSIIEVLLTGCLSAISFNSMSLISLSSSMFRLFRTLWLMYDITTDEAMLVSMNFLISYSHSEVSC